MVAPAQIAIERSSSSPAAGRPTAHPISRASNVQQLAAQPSEDSTDILVLTLSLPAADVHALQSALDGAEAGHTHEAAASSAAASSSKSSRHGSSSSASVSSHSLTPSSALTSGKINVAGGFTFEIASTDVAASSDEASATSANSNVAASNTTPSASTVTITAASPSENASRSTQVLTSSASGVNAGQSATQSQSSRISTKTVWQTRSAASASTSASSDAALEATSSSIKIAVGLTSTHIKAVGTQIVFTTIATGITQGPATGSTSSSPAVSTGSADGGATSAGDPYSHNPFFNFLHSLGSSPAAIALTVLVCLGIAGLICASIAFCIRRARRKARRGIMNVSVDQSMGKYSDVGSAYSDMHSFRQRNSRFFGEHAPAMMSTAPSATALPIVRLSRAADQDPFSDNSRVLDDDRLPGVYEVRNSYAGQAGWSRDINRRPSSLEASVINHLTAGVGVPSQERASAAGERNLQDSPTSSTRNASQNPHHYSTTTVASSPYLEPPMDAPLRSTYLGSFSASALPDASVTAAMGRARLLEALKPMDRYDTAAQSPAAKSVVHEDEAGGASLYSPSLNSLLVPPMRPNRPPSLTSSFKHAVEEHLSESNPFEFDQPPAMHEPSTVRPVKSPLSRSASSSHARPSTPSGGIFSGHANCGSETLIEVPADNVLADVDGPAPEVSGAVTFRAIPDIIEPSAAAVQSAWGVRTISQVFNASSSAVKGLLSPSTSFALASPTYDEEKADLFTELPTNIPRRASSRWGSFASQGSTGSMDRRLYQQQGHLPAQLLQSRFSVTTLPSNNNSPTPTADSGSAASIYHDWQIRSALRTQMTVPRKAPELVAQRLSGSVIDQLSHSTDSSVEADVLASTPSQPKSPGEVTASEGAVGTPDDSDPKQCEQSSVQRMDSSSMERGISAGAASTETASTGLFAYTAPLNIAEAKKRPSISHASIAQQLSGRDPGEREPDA